MCQPAYASHRHLYVLINCRSILVFSIYIFHVLYFIFSRPVESIDLRINEYLHSRTQFVFSAAGRSRQYSQYYGTCTQPKYNKTLMSILFVLLFQTRIAVLLRTMTSIQSTSGESLSVVHSHSVNALPVNSRLLRVGLKRNVNPVQKNTNDEKKGHICYVYETLYHTWLLKDTHSCCPPPQKKHFVVTIIASIIAERFTVS